MKITNILTDLDDIFIDFLLNKMTINNINYLMINYEEYVELHVSNNIYRIYDKKHIDLNKSYIYLTIMDLIPYFNKYSKDLTHLNFIDNQISSINLKKEKPGYKKYTKRMIKNDSKKYSIKYNSKSRK